MCGGILRDCATEDRGMSPLSKSEHVINLDALGHSWSGGAPPCFTFMASHIPTSMRRSMSAESSFRAVLGVGRTCDATCAAVSSEHGDGILRILRTGKRARGSGCTSGNSRRLPPSREHYTCCVVSFDAASRNRQSLLHHLDVRSLEDRQCRSSRSPPSATRQVRQFGSVRPVCRRTLCDGFGRRRSELFAATEACRVHEAQLPAKTR